LYGSILKAVAGRAVFWGEGEGTILWWGGSYPVIFPPFLHLRAFYGISTFAFVDEAMNGRQRIGGIILSLGNIQGRRDGMGWDEGFGGDI
jgi:hypothetical protein